jgi:hypothetical protein
VLPLLKAYTTRTALEVVDICLTHCGAVGFISSNRLNAYRGFVHSYFCAAGDNDLILMDTAQAMINPGARQPSAPTLTDLSDADITAPDVCVSLARAAECYFHRDLADRVTSARNDGQDEFTVWNDNLALAQTAAAAQADRIVVELLAAAHENAPRPARLLLRLYMLSWIERHVGVLADQRLTPPHLYSRIWKHRRALCDELEPHLQDLVSAFESPETLD